MGELQHARKRRLLGAGVAGVVLAASFLSTAGSASAVAPRPPGRSLIVTFQHRATATARARAFGLVRAVGHARLPLIPYTYEVTIPVGSSVAAAVRRLAAERSVVLVQPDRRAGMIPESIQDDASYWPNDPYYWMAKVPCPFKDIGQWNLWPVDLSNTETYQSYPAISEFNPLSQADRADQAGGVPGYGPGWGIDVQPVWFLLRGAHRLTGPHGELGDQRAWSPEDLRQAGIATIDNGLSQAPDIRGQIAALFSVVTKRDSGEFIRQIYGDNPDRDDLKAVARVFNTASNSEGRTIRVQAARRKISGIDDFWFDSQGRLKAPTGCSGHGTEVASIAAARTGNKEGIAGVAYNAPIVGIRDGVVWDAPDGGALASNPDAARQAWERDKHLYTVTDTNQIEKLWIAEAMGVPVVNMSFLDSEPLMTERTIDRAKRLIVNAPELAAAYAKLLTSGRVIGVAAAGDNRERYGTGLKAEGAGAQQRLRAPCGLKLIDIRNAYVDTHKEGADQYRHFDEVFGPVNWHKLNLLCVAATKTEGELLDVSGAGTAVVDLAAPGKRIPVAAVPDEENPSQQAYDSRSGTSASAAEVSGAVSLLRVAAPRAPLSEISLALRRGARRANRLTGLVRYGQLDVGCALVSLVQQAQREHAGWGLPTTSEFSAWVEQRFRSKACTGLPVPAQATILRLSKDEVFAESRRYGSLAALIAAAPQAAFHNDPRSPGRLWQALLGGGTASRSALEIPSREWKPVTEIDRPVYVAGTTGFDALNTTGCGPGPYDITGLTVKLTPSSLQGWLLPGDTYAPQSRMAFMFALKKPWYAFALPKRLTLRITAQCERFSPDF